MEFKTKTIPKIIHQLWIGDKPMPTKLMDTWSKTHPDFTYILWTEAEFKRRNFTFRCQQQINIMSEICGKADIMRWEILYHFGGVFIDADSICIEPLDSHIMCKKAFASYENEVTRQGLIAVGTMGFYPNHPLCKHAIQWILTHNMSVENTGKRAWCLTGPILLTNLVQKYMYKDLTLFPSYYFLPVHYLHNTPVYKGHHKVYAHQEWGSTYKNYDNMNFAVLPKHLLVPEPNEWVSILIASYNTNHAYITECIKSIQAQQGHIGFEVVWINDGSNENNSVLLERELDKMIKQSRFIQLSYKKMQENCGLSACLNIGLQMATHEIIIRMDSDDIMMPHRIQTQLNFLRDNDDCVMCGSNMIFLKQEQKQGTIPNLDTYKTHHVFCLTWEAFKIAPSHWIMNHPTLCFKKSVILSVGGYDLNLKIGEDFNLELKVLKKYEVIYNIQECLLYYRTHNQQLTFNGRSYTPELIEFRNDFIKKMIE
jgi:mannosyltransferase OCH1-like enzyme